MNRNEPAPKSELIRAYQIAVLNDYLRLTFNGNLGHAIISREVNALPKADQDGLVEAVKTAHTFSKDLDPKHHHVAGRASYGAHIANWNIEYFPREGKPLDPANLTASYRVLRIDLGQ